MLWEQHLSGLYYINPKYWDTLTLLLLNTTCPVLANSVDPDQLAGSALFVIKYVNFYQETWIK